jgi:hypothetical protein
MLKVSSAAFCIFLLIELGCTSKIADDPDDKARLLQLENQWFEAEFSADTSFLATLLDSTFVCVTDGGVLKRPEILKKIHANKTFRDSKGIVIDSVAMENSVIKLYGDFAVVTFIDHTYGRKQGVPLEFKTQFYDAWIKRAGQWKAVSSQAHY